MEASGKPGGLAVALAGARRGGTVLLVGLQDRPVTANLYRTVRDEVNLVASNGHICDADVPEALAYWPQPTSARPCDMNSRSPWTRLPRPWKAWPLGGYTARSSSRSDRQ